MTSLRDTSGNVLNKTELLALMTEQTQAKVYKVNADILQRFTQDGASFEGAEKLIMYNGQFVTQAFVDALFKTATVTALSPATGLAAGGTVVTITGTNLAGVEGVTFGGTAGTGLVVVSETQIRITTPAKTAGTYNVVIKDDAGDVTVTNGYIYT